MKVRKARGHAVEARLRRETRELRAAIALLHRISGLVGGALTREAACHAVLTGVTAGVGLGLDRAMLFLVDPADRSALRGAGAIGLTSRAEADCVWRAIAASSDEGALHAACERARSDDLDRRARAAVIDAASDTPVALAFRRGALVLGEGSDAGGLFHPPTGIAAPVHDRGATLGVLYADNALTRRRPGEIPARVFAMIAERAGQAIENARRFERIAGEARTDALTGLGHHGAFMTDLGVESASAIAQGRPLGLLMIDIDGFKQVNDRLGHLAGDALLAGLAARMRGVVRGRQGVYRYGGDEFAVIVPGAGRAAAALVGERVLRAVVEQPFSLGEPGTIRVTCSIGAAALPEDARGSEALIAAADEALRRAKARGKNVVEEF